MFSWGKEKFFRSRTSFLSVNVYKFAAIRNINEVKGNMAKIKV